MNVINVWSTYKDIRQITNNQHNGQFVSETTNICVIGKLDLRELSYTSFYGNFN